MAEIRQKLRGTTLQLDQYVGQKGQILFNTQNYELRAYDGVTLGGHRIPTMATALEAFQLPNRLKPDGKEITGNLNDAVEAGFYRLTVTATSTPEAASTGSVMVIPNTDDGKVAQICVSAATGITYTRKFDGVVWSAWERLVTKSYGDTIYLGIGAKAADAELLDGNDSSYYTNIAARLGYTPANKAGDTFTGPITLSGAFPTIYFTDTDGGVGDFILQANNGIFSIFADRDSSGAVEAPHPLQLDSVNDIAYAFGSKIWTQGNDGAGSGLDADLLDGISSASFARTDSRSFISTPAAMPSMATATGSLGEMEFGSGGTDAAAIAFSRTGFGMYLGVDSDNKLKRGGWSLGANAYEIWDAGNQPVATYSATADTLVKRDVAGDIYARLLRQTYNVTNGVVNYIMTQVDFTTNNYIRPSTPAQVAAGLPVASGSAQGMMSAELATFFGTPAAGAVFCKKLQPANYNLVINQYLTAYLAVEIAGTFRITGSHRGGSGQVSTVQIWKNGTIVQTWTDSSGSFQNRTIDITVAAGDIIRWRAGTNSDADWGPANNWQISCDAYRYIGSLTVFPVQT